jgi:hypothetical protein
MRRALPGLIAVLAVLGLLGMHGIGAHGFAGYDVEAQAGTVSVLSAHGSTPPDRMPAHVGGVGAHGFAGHDTPAQAGLVSVHAAGHAATPDGMPAHDGVSLPRSAEIAPRGGAHPAMACMVVLLLAMSFLLPHARRVTTDRGTPPTAAFFRVAVADAPPRPPSLHALCISRT